MTPYNAVFKRVEKKYRLRDFQRRAVEAAAAERGAMAVDAYGRCRITSLYLDTPDRAMIARSVEKPLYKEKLRLRAYGDAVGAALMAAFGGEPLVREASGAALSDRVVEARAAAGMAAARAFAGGAAGTPDPSRTLDPTTITVFFGIKKKFKGIVYKRRLALSLPAAVAFVSGLSYELAVTRWPLADEAQARAALAPATRQIARELAAAMDRWLPLAPSMGIACDREAWAPTPSASAPGSPAAPSDLRLTFDDRLEYFDCHNTGGALGTCGWQPIIDADESILEIKSAGPYPPWLVQALSANAIYPASFTKYGNAYQRCEGTALQRAVAMG